MKAMRTFMERNKGNKDYGTVQDPRGYIMDSLFDISKDQSNEKLNKATKYLRNLSFDAHDKNNLLDQIEEAEISYDLFQRKLDKQESFKLAKQAKKAKYCRKRIVVPQGNFNKIDPYERNILDKLQKKQHIILKDIKFTDDIYYNYTKRQLYNKKQILDKQKFLKDIEEIRLSVTRNRERVCKQKAAKKKEDGQDRNDSCEKNHKSSNISSIKNSSIFEHNENTINRQIQENNRRNIPSAHKIGDVQLGSGVNSKQRRTTSPNRNSSILKKHQRGDPKHNLSESNQDISNMRGSKNFIRRNKLQVLLKNRLINSTNQKVRAKTTKTFRRANKSGLVKPFANTQRNSQIKSAIPDSLRSLKKEGKTMNMTHDDLGFPKKQKLFTILEPNFNKNSRMNSSLSLSKTCEHPDDNLQRSSRKGPVSFYKSKTHKAKKLRSKIYSIYKACDDATTQGKEDMKILLFERFQNNIRRKEFCKTLSLMETLNFATTNSFKTMHDYMKEDHDQIIQNQLSIMEDYNTGKGDPSRIVARIERATKTHKNWSKKKTRCY
ncbi:unnamed protein product [Moneuplotes crassus]|uniref:Uncharacterized protein n=1 Tax=Euplotes crassus TaxID=5936 RepID=A0AAD1X413_EUPCR|nr:unnamed protein product [Moneuplotes crassus]